MSRVVKPWTTKELREAKKLWLEGMSIVDMARALGRTRESVKHVTNVDRERFPRRRRARKQVRPDKDVKYMKFPVSPFLHKKLFEVARRRGVSGNMVIEEVLRKYLLGPDGQLPRG